MSEGGRWIAGGVLAFLLGSIPTGLILGRLVRGIDVRNHGSGNLGATNVYRLLGPAWGLTVLLLDAAKGVAAVIVVRTLCAAAGQLDSGALVTTGGAALGGTAPAAWAGLLGLAGVVLGHSFSPFAGFRGGKGVAAAAGAWGALAPAALGLALLVWGIVFAATRIVSVGSLAAALVLPIALVLVTTGPKATNPLVWAGALTALLVWMRHRANLVRLLRGEERPLQVTGTPRPKVPSSPSDQRPDPGGR